MESLEPLSAEEALNAITKYLLGDDWYVVDPIHAHQVNAVIVDEIKQKYNAKLPLSKKVKRFLYKIADRL